MKRALFSVSNKRGVIGLAEYLTKFHNYNILSTGGTFKTLCGTDSLAGRIQNIGEYIDYPEILGGRVKTLHPKIHGGILAREDQLEEIQTLDIDPISIVVSNLYPFEAVVGDSKSTHKEIIENIDIGGVTLLRGAAKNSERVLVLSDPEDYETAMELMSSGNDKEMQEFREECASKAFLKTCEYDAAISDYLSKGKYKTRVYEKQVDLKYGTNPHQKNSSLFNIHYPRRMDTVDEKYCGQEKGALKILNGNPSYINLMDAMNAWGLVRDLDSVFQKPAAASFKHTSPAGAAIAIPLNYEESECYAISAGSDLKNLNENCLAYVRARNGDPKSSFGDFIGLSRIVDEETANFIKMQVSDGIIAPGYTPEALEILSKKKKGNYLVLSMQQNSIEMDNKLEYREIGGIAISQTPNYYQFGFDDLKVVTQNKELSDAAKRDLLVANIALKYAQSNSIAFAKNGQIIGLGCGQQNRVDCVKLAGTKALVWDYRQNPVVRKYMEMLCSRNKFKPQEIVNEQYEYIDNAIKNGLPEILKGEDIALASDGFFPFTDNIEVAHSYGVKHIIQPGGSVADKKVIDMCNRLGIDMVCSGVRVFTH